MPETQVQPRLSYTITITYGPIDLASGRAISSTLALHLWNGTAWVPESTSRLDVEAYTVTARPAASRAGRCSARGCPEAGCICPC